MTVIRRMDMAWQAPRVSTLVRLLTIPAGKQVALPCAYFLLSEELSYYVYT